MKHISISVVVILASLILVSCNKQATTPEQAPEVKTYKLEITAAKDFSTKQLVLDGTGKILDAVWADGEIVNVYHGSDKIGELSPLSFGSEQTVLSGDVTLSGYDPSTDYWIDLVFGGDLSGQDGSLSTISQNHDWAKAWFKIKEIDGDKIIPEGDVTFYNWFSVIRFDVKNGGSSLSVSKMEIRTTTGYPAGGDGHSITVLPNSATSELYVALSNLDNLGDPISDDYEIVVTDTDGRLYSCKATGKVFSKGGFYIITLNVKQDTYTVVGEPIEVLPGDSTWDIDATDNNLIFNAETGLYSKTFSVPASTTSVVFKVVRNYDWDNGSWPASNREVSSSNGYSANLTISFNPSTGEVTTNIENTSSYRLYVLPEKIATGNYWGSTHSVWGGYDFIASNDTVFGSYTYKCFVIPDAIVDGNDHDIYYKGQDNSEILFDDITLSSGTQDYFFRTDGIFYTSVTSPSSPESLPSNPRFYIRTNITNFNCHMWGGPSATTWPGVAFTPIDHYAKEGGDSWYYVDILPGTTQFIINNNDWQTGDLDLDNSSISHYYKLYYYENAPHLEETWNN